MLPPLLCSHIFELFYKKCAKQLLKLNTNKSNVLPLKAEAAFYSLLHISRTNMISDLF